MLGRARRYRRRIELQAAFKETGPWISQFEIDGRLYGGSYDAVNDLRLAMFLEQVSVRGQRVLEMGPLEAGHTLALVRAGAREILAVEGRAENLQRCNLIKDIFGLDGVTFRQGDIRDITCRTDGTFDVALCMGVLYHVPDPDRVLVQLRELAPITLLWTHVADEEHPRSAQEGKLVSTYGSGTFLGKLNAEDISHPLSAIDSEVIWLYKSQLVDLISAVGFRECKILGEWPADSSPGPAILATLHA